MGVEGPAVATCCGAGHGATHMGEVRADKTGKQKRVRDWAECVLRQ